MVRVNRLEAADRETVAKPKKDRQNTVLWLWCMTSHSTTPSRRSRRPKAILSDQTASLFSDEELGQAPAAKVPANGGPNEAPQTPADVRATSAEITNTAYQRHKQSLVKKNRKRFWFEGPESVWDRVKAYADAEGITFGYAAICLIKPSLKTAERRLRRQGSS